MRLFVREMRSVGVDPELAFTAIGAASDFDPGSYLGDYVGLAMVRRDDLAAAGFPPGQQLYSLPASEQIPWIARVLEARMAATGHKPKTVGELAVMLHRPKSPMVDMVRIAAEKRAADAKRSAFYLRHLPLLRRALKELE